MADEQLFKHPIYPLKPFTMDDLRVDGDRYFARLKRLMNGDSLMMTKEFEVPPQVVDSIADVIQSVRALGRSAPAVRDASLKAAELLSGAMADRLADTPASILREASLAYMQGVVEGAAVVVLQAPYGDGNHHRINWRRQWDVDTEALTATHRTSGFSMRFEPQSGGGYTARLNCELPAFGPDGELAMAQMFGLRTLLKDGWDIWHTVARKNRVNTTNEPPTGSASITELG